MNRPCRFVTSRLAVDDWHSWSSASNDEDLLPEFVCKLLSPAVTASLPAAWQGDYSLQRALDWIEGRDKESTISMAVHRESGLPAGLIILADSGWPDIHIGFLLLQSEWGKGLATELVQGLVKWCQENAVRSIVGGTALGNLPSQSVLQKNGFTRKTRHPGDTELCYELRL